MQLIPAPVSLHKKSGAFTLSDSTTISCKGGDAANEVAKLLAEYLRPTGLKIRIVKGEGSIKLEQTANPEPDELGLLPEDYTLCVSKAQVSLRASSAAGLARGVQTLRQLLPAQIYSMAKSKGKVNWSIPAVQIEDSPRFRWRGLHLDCSRHFFSIKETCRFIELMAQHKMNVLHWHLTDDQGWRVQIKKYPKLTEIGAFREQSLVGHYNDFPHKYDGKRYGGFYTQEELRSVVEFAARRHITIVPEIDMPGHCMAAIAAYPWLGCGISKADKVRCCWGISREVLNLDDRTVQFCKDVWKEVMDIFPAKVCHIGGDEAPRYEWENSPAAHELMAKRGIASPYAMQSWFTSQMEQFFAENGRRLTGWDEIMDGGELAPSTIAMFWRSWENGPKMTAFAKTHDIIMAPTSHTYFDYYQSEFPKEEPLAIGGCLTTSHVYAFDPSAQFADKEAAAHIIGAQGQLWTEYIDSFDYLTYMTYPRACALCEVLWTPQAQRTWRSFKERLAAHRERLAVQKVNAHPEP